MKLRIELKTDDGTIRTHRSARVVNAETGELVQYVSKVLIDLTPTGNKAVLVLCDFELDIDEIEAEVTNVGKPLYGSAEATAGTSDKSC